MFGLLAAVVVALIGGFLPRAQLVAENLALRQQLAVLQRETRRPRLVPLDRAFWVLLSRVWSRWSGALVIVKPETVIAWHRRGFAQFWAWKSRRRGRPPTPPEIVALIVRMANDNPKWSALSVGSHETRITYDR